MGKLLTYAQAKTSRTLANVSGVCGDSDQFKAYLNQATEALMLRREWGWFATVQKMRVCVYNNCIVWPREVGTVLATNVCNQGILQQNFWYEYLPMSRSDWSWAPDWRGRLRGGNAVMENAGRTSVFANVPCNKMFYVRAYPSQQADIGKTITIFGIDNNGQVIRTVQNGTLQEGVVLTLASPYAVTPTMVQQIDRVVKDKTQGMVYLRFYDSVNDVLWNCADYYPNDTTPDYLFERIVGCGPRRNASCPITAIDALVSLQFIPVENDNDLVLIRNERALKHMIQCIRYEDEGDKQQAKIAEGDAFRELNYELRANFPLEQTVVDFRPYGTASFNRQMAGFI